MKKRIAFQGTFGAYSDLACRAMMPDCETVPCVAFEDVFESVDSGRADFALLPIENSTSGRVADMHQLMPNSRLHIIAEHFQPVIHHLLAVTGAKLDDLKRVRSHSQSLMQCRRWLRDRGIEPVVDTDNGQAAENVAKLGDKSTAAIASELAGKLYGLQSIASDIADMKGNTTRFLLLSREAIRPKLGTVPCVTTMIFRVRSVPAALYKALGGFATNGVNITKLESYLIDGGFNSARFYLDAEGHPDEIPMRLALEELGFFANEIKILGVYPAHAFRRGISLTGTKIEPC